MREVTELYVSGIKNIRKTQKAYVQFLPYFYGKQKDLGQKPMAFGGEMNLDFTGLSQLPVVAKQDGRGYKTKMRVHRKHSFPPDPDTKSAYAFVTSSSVLQVTLECGKLVASILHIHCTVSKRMLQMPNNTEDKKQNSCIRL